MLPNFAASIPVVAALLALPVLTRAQAPVPLPESPVPTAITAPAPRRLLLKLGLTPSRLLPQYRRNGFNWVVAPSVGAEYQLGPHISLYGQADIDFSFSHRDYYASGVPEKEALVHSGALGLGLRYYYNQAGRERHHRVHGAFQGNYLALEVLTELDRIRYYFYDISYPYPGTESIEYRIQTTPLLNAYWGLQRRLGKHFLYDVNAGVGIIAKPTADYYYPFYRRDRTLYYLNGAFAVNLRLYVVR